ncbi:hypothetical protein C7S20_16770 [Christiangramia fulva]|uniref:CBS domain-containing protein n=1 Tax=Christiangramia fulva TaxID=2126553 RepID=A0A2R3Z936_9FLAO|nr:CBS domain-containing protein [Christiangramia fulva]AVR46781.1 hypothetical protein C7S20_16770 [Christiangramia fulva]
MDKAEKFIDTYNKIDKFLRESENSGSYVTFSQKIKNSKNQVVQRYGDELISLGELRNAIVHNPRYGNKPIAEPYESTVKRIEELFEKITNPKKVIPLFQFEVLGAQEEDFVNDILIQMKKNSFSQFPVFDENKEVIELINNNTISIWLSSQLEEDGTIMTEKVKIKDLIPEIEFNENYRFVSRSTSIYEAYQMFIDQINNKERNLDVIFITHSGKKNEKLLGLITIEDIANQV